MNSILSVPSRILKSEHLSLVLRLIVGFYFIYASMSKIPYPAQFADAVASYRLFPYWSINLIAVAVPWLELMCGLFLILGLWTRATALTIILLFLTFNVLIGINVLRGSPITCGCFDTIGEPISWWKITKNTGWLLLTVQVFFFDRLFLLRMGGMFGKKARNSLPVS
ncbi:MAG: DoxX family membrane protein [Deltaproteobacteria bacterium]|nr:DoxX family membrane protein [Deltaproteobacteria bacterium]MBW2051718.1 DoxX family membrane protein [Deltaproteobacteria bacterium]MBW2140257.1 DoxX family membrane protein [Deltaproteobacteria bacterium]MBW2323336.1 DoxX family membrane protein [Deltaproteobacteria bacterium]